MGNPEWITTTRAAERLDVSDDTVRHWIDNGKLAGWRLPGGSRASYRADARDVDRISAGKRSAVSDGLLGFLATRPLPGRDVRLVHYLLVYDHRQRRFVEQHAYVEAEAAGAAYAEQALWHRKDRDLEILLLRADSIETILRSQEVEEPALHRRGERSPDLGDR